MRACQGSLERGRTQLRVAVAPIEAEAVDQCDAKAIGEKEADGAGGPHGKLVVREELLPPALRRPDVLHVCLCLRMHQRLMGEPLSERQQRRGRDAEQEGNQQLHRDGTQPWLPPCSLRSPDGDQQQRIQKQML